MGRLKPDWTIQRATAEMDALSPGIFEATALLDRDAHTIETYKKFKLAAYPASTGVSALRDYDRSLMLLLGIAGLVLLIACANLANLMLARASTRQLIWRRTHWTDAAHRAGTQLSSTVYEIVSVIPDTKYNDLRGQIPPMTFAPASQFPNQGPWSNVMIHSNLAPAAIAATAKRQIAGKHRDVITEFVDFQRQIRDGLVEERLMAMLSGFFGLLAVLLAVVGLYGVISYIVAMRRNEIGIRMALGASRGDVVGIIVRQTLVLLVLGVGAGIVLALAAARGAGSLLFDLRPNDPITFAVATGVLVSIALVASFIPARRAARVDPMVALRYE